MFILSAVFFLFAVVKQSGRHPPVSYYLCRPDIGLVSHLMGRPEKA